MNEIKNPSLKKVWRKTDYTINVLTNLTMSDTSWIGGNATKEYPIGEDAGCRLEVYNFGSSESYKVLISKFCELYLRKETLTAEERKKYNEYIKKLRVLRVVVVELCGC